MWVLTLQALPYTVANTFMDQVHHTDGSNEGVNVRPFLDAYGCGS
jgi:hypothetical protein